MQANAEAQAQEAESEGLVLMRKLRAHYGGDDSMALRDACMTVVQLNENANRNLSYGYVRGRGLPKPNTGTIVPKPRVQAIDIPPVAAQMGD